ncbi:MAG: ABC transporter ATP-binding protein [Clostridiales bacterium]|nr:ABC transporter ATP-binding protein [Clostridiales bacterium]
MKKFIKCLQFVWRYSDGIKSKILFLFIVNILNIAFRIATPLVSAQVIIKLSNGDYNSLIYWGIILFTITLLEYSTYYLSRTRMSFVYQRLSKAITKDIAENILKITNDDLDKAGSGIFLQRINSDTDKLADIFYIVFDVIGEVFIHVGNFVAIFILNYIAGIFVLLMMVILFIIENIRAKKKEKLDKILRKARDNLSTTVSELVRGSRDIKMLNSEKDFLSKFDKDVDIYSEKYLRLRNITYKWRLLSWNIDNILELVFILLLVFIIKEKYIVSASAVVLYTYVRNSHGFYYLVGDLISYFKEFDVSRNRLEEIIGDKLYKKEKFGDVHLDKINGDFEFRNVDFSYGKNKVLKNLSFKIAANSTVAFVGKSGTGKTTIFNLLVKMYDVDSGQILIDNHDVKTLDKDTIRGNITIISQNPYIFNMTIKENLQLVKKDLTDEEMKEACRLACLDKFIENLENKYDTVIGEGGVNLSGGQKQRLAIARALIQKTEIILFDEATSALDNETQYEIQKAIENMEGEYTILIIAHRLSTIKKANKIFYLEEGQIIDSGSHEYLINNCKPYKYLYETEIEKD